MSTRIETLRGKYVDPLNMAPDDLDIEAIAHALSNQCRFNGYTSRHYSVAEHSYYVSCLVERQARMAGVSEDEVLQVALAGLLHDATEAYLVDIPRPLKSALPEYMAIEDRLWAVIAVKYGVPEKMHPMVKEADKRICLTEKLALLTSKGLARPEWASMAAEYAPYTEGEVTIPTAHIAPETARAWFLQRFRGLQQRIQWLERF